MPNRSATSPGLLRRLNCEAVLRHALDTDQFTAGQVMDSTGLTRATVLGIVTDLVEQGWLMEVSGSTAAPSAKGGRPSRIYHIPHTAGLLLGLDAGEHRFRASMTDLRGEHHRTHHLTIDGPASGQDRLSTAANLIDQLLENANAKPTDVLLSVVGVPAPVDSTGQSPPGDRGFWTTMNPGFTQVLPGRVVVENDANLAAIAEHARMPDGDGRNGNMAALLSGERLGAGLIVDGRLLHGARGGAGELRVLEHVTGVGSSSGFGALAREWAKESTTRTNPENGRGLPSPEDSAIDAEWVFTAAGRGDPRAQEIIERLGRRLASVALLLGSLLDVTTVVVAGAVAQAAQPVIDEARRQLSNDLHAPVLEIVASGLGGDVVALGALQHALQLLKVDPLSFTPASP